MSNLCKTRKPDAVLLQEIRSAVALSDGVDLITPDGCWDIIIVKERGSSTVMLVNRPLIYPVWVPHAAGLEMLTITFAVGAFIDSRLPVTPSGMIILPLAGKNKFWLGASAIEIPNFANADIFGEQLRRKRHLMGDEVVMQTVNGQTTVNERTRQRHFRRITGMTRAYFRQVQHAHAAATQLRRGTGILQVAHDLGYSDQFHLAKSLRRILGQTPSQIQRSAS